MVSFYVVGAEQKNQVLKDWEQYKKGVIVRVSPDAHLAKKCVEYRSPASVCPEQSPSISFTAATMTNGHLYVGTQTEILVYSIPDFKRTCYLTLPYFNDIHHVRPAKNGNLLIANTGLDMVIEVSPKGKVLNEWNVLNEKPWGRFSRKVDYRKVPTTKPHQSHPNYVFQIGEDIWVTRCLQKDAICLTNPGQIRIGHEKIHDGVVFGQSIYFTRVDGYVAVANIHNHKVSRVFNLNQITNGNTRLGWCRGIKVLDDNKVIVGFTRIRPSKKKNADGKIVWQGEFGTLPTRIACYDLKNRKLLWEQPVEKYGINAVYSIHSANA